jgi:hypothetical protein
MSVSSMSLFFQYKNISLASFSFRMGRCPRKIEINCIFIGVYIQDLRSAVFLLIGDPLLDCEDCLHSTIEN